MSAGLYQFLSSPSLSSPPFAPALKKPLFFSLLFFSEKFEQEIKGGMEKGYRESYSNPNIEGKGTQSPKSQQQKEKMKKTDIFAG